MVGERKGCDRRCRTSNRCADSSFRCAILRDMGHELPGMRSGPDYSGDHIDGEPIMSDTREKAIRERAYLLWERSGSRHGQHGEHWDQAAREIDAEAGSVKPKGKPGRKPAAAASPTVEKRKPGPKPKAVVAPPATPEIVAKKKPGPKPKTAAVATETPTIVAKAKPGPKPAATPKPVSAPAIAAKTESAPAKAVSKAKQAAETVVATVKRATKGSAKK